MGGQKRKIPMEKIEKKEKRSVAFSKRREGLYRKASELCLLFDAHIAILATPPSSKSTVSFYSFGHSSVDDVVDAFLQNRGPSVADDGLSKRFVCGKKDGRLAGKKRCQGLGLWWEEDGFDGSENAVELKDAIDEILKLKNDVNLRLNAKKDQEDSSEDVFRDLEAFLNEPEQNSSQCPRVAEELQDFWVQCFCDDDTEDVFRNLGASLMDPRNSNQTQKISGNSDGMVESEDKSQKNHVLCYNDCKDEEEVRAIESGSVSENRVEDQLDDINFDDF